MALQPVSIFESDATGSKETITLHPVPPAASTNVTIASAVYGNPSELVPIAPDRKSLSITVQQGTHPLVVTLVSPDPKDEIVQLSQGSTKLANPVVRQHSGVSTIFIQGT